MNTYKMEYHLKYPKCIVRNIKFEKCFRLATLDSSVIAFYRSMETAVRYLILGDFHGFRMGFIAKLKKIRLVRLLFRA